MENMDPDVAGLVDEVNDMVRAKLVRVRAACVSNIGSTLLCAICSVGLVMASRATSGSTSSLMFLMGMGCVAGTLFCAYEVAKGISWLWVFRNFERDARK